MQFWVKYAKQRLSNRDLTEKNVRNEKYFPKVCQHQFGMSTLLCSNMVTTYRNNAGGKTELLLRQVAGCRFYTTFSVFKNN